MMALLADLSDKELLALDDKCHKKSHVDENLIDHMDVMTEMQSRGLPHTDESILTKATIWWMENNTRFDGPLEKSYVRKYMPNVSLVGALRYRNRIGPNEYIDVAISGNDEAMSIVKECSRPEIITRLRFNMVEKPTEFKPPTIPSFTKLNDFWHEFGYKHIGKGLLIIKSQGTRYFVTKDKVWDEESCDVTRQIPQLLELVKSLPEAVYMVDFTKEPTPQATIIDYTTPQPTTYIQRYTALKAAIPDFVPQFTPVSAVVSLSKSIESGGNYYVISSDVNSIFYLNKTVNGIFMIKCKFDKSDGICPIRKSDVKYPVECDFSDSYVCPYVKEIYYGDEV